MAFIIKLPFLFKVLIGAFRSVDQYTLMSLCDVIFHTCTSYKELSFELAFNVMPILSKHFNSITEEQSNSIFSLIGKIFSHHNNYRMLIVGC